MAKYAVTGEQLGSIADAIRAKGETSAPLVFPDGFINAIQDIPDRTVDYAPSLIGGTLTEYTNLTLSTIRSYGFDHCTTLERVSFPLCQTIGVSAFAYCTALAHLSFPACTSIGSYAFTFCSRLSSTAFPECTYVGGNAFQYCSGMISVQLPKCSVIREYAFLNCDKLSAICLPACTYVSVGAFRYCANLSTVVLPACSTLRSSAFDHCYRLLSLYLFGEVPFDNFNVFTSTPISNYTSYTDGVYGSIYVPASLLTYYQTAYNWSFYSERFVGLTYSEIRAVLDEWCPSE